MPNSVDRTAGEAVLITFQGGIAEFHEKLKNWFNAHPDWPFSIVSGPDSCNILLVQTNQHTADTIYARLKAQDEPEGLYVAGVPEQGFRSKRFVRGVDANCFDPATRQMAQSGRKVGVTPRQLAENGGW